MLVMDDSTVGMNNGGININLIKTPPPKDQYILKYPNGKQKNNYNNNCKIKKINNYQILKFNYVLIYFINKKYHKFWSQPKGTKFKYFITVNEIL